MTQQPPNKTDLLANINANFPGELLSKPIWIPYYYKHKPDNTYTKPPISPYTVKDDGIGLEYDQAIQLGYPGIKMALQKNLIAIDIDDKLAKQGQRQFPLLNPLNNPLFSTQFSSFLAKYPTYTEISPSQCGLRILFYADPYLPQVQKRHILNPEHAIGGELFFGTGFVTITGNKVMSSATSIQRIDPNELLQWCRQPQPSSAGPQSNSGIKNSQALKLAFNPPSLLELQSALSMCQLDQSSRVLKAYREIFSEHYNHYDFWIRIMAACHHYSAVTGSEVKVLPLVLEWSATDPSAYVSQDDVLRHWESFSEHEQQVTYQTLFKFSRLLKFNWPLEKREKSGALTGKPLMNESSNFEYLADYYNVKFYSEPYSQQIYVSGDSHIVNTHFHSLCNSRFFEKVGPLSEESIIDGCWTFAQRCHYDNCTRQTIAPVAKIVLKRSLARNTFNILDTWLNTEYSDLPDDIKEPDTDPEVSNLDFLISCLELNDQQNSALAKEYLEAFFFGIVMPVYNPKRIWPEHNFMLILSGSENCRKSSFLANLMPESIRHFMIGELSEKLQSDKSLRDMKIMLTSKALAITDEFEMMFRKESSAEFKNLVTASSFTYVPIYSKTPITAVRTAALAGATNKMRLALEQDSSRRIALINVNKIDTESLKRIRWHTFYKDYVERGRLLIKQNIFPWKLSQETINIQYQENEKFRAPTDIEVVLLELYDWEYPFPALSSLQIQSVQAPNPWLNKVSDIVGTIKQVYPRMYLKSSALKNTLERLCGRYTHTTNITRSMPYCKAFIRNGVVKQGPYIRYIMPPKNADFEGN